jgi:hypothetical protein
MIRNGLEGVVVIPKTEEEAVARKYVAKIAKWELAEI